MTYQTIRVPSLTLLIGILIGIGIGWKLYHPEPIIESYKPEVRTSNGTVALERKAELPPPEPIKVAAKEVGGELKRAGTVVLQPKPTEDSSPECKCEEITLDFGTVDQGDGERVIFHTEDAEILGGVDSPQVPYMKYDEPKWDVGVMIPFDNPKGIGPAVSKKMGAFKVGIAAAKPRQGGWTAFATVQISF